MEEEYADITQEADEHHITGSDHQVYICFLEEVFISPFLFFAPFPVYKPADNITMQM